MQDPRCVPGELEKQGKTAYTLLHNVGLGGSYAGPGKSKGMKREETYSDMVTRLHSHPWL
jgi:hypothetical protein